MTVSLSKSSTPPPTALSSYCWLWLSLCLTLKQEDNQKPLSLCQETNINTHKIARMPAWHTNVLAAAEASGRLTRENKARVHKQRARLFGLVRAKRWKANKMTWLRRTWGERSSVLVPFWRVCACVCVRVCVHQQRWSLSSRSLNTIASTAPYSSSFNGQTHTHTHTHSCMHEMRESKNTHRHTHLNNLHTNPLIDLSFVKPSGTIMNTQLVNGIEAKLLNS